MREEFNLITTIDSLDCKYRLVFYLFALIVVYGWVAVVCNMPFIIDFLERKKFRRVRRNEVFPSVKKSVLEDFDQLKTTVEEFDQLVRDAIDALPEEFIAIMNKYNLSIATQDAPTNEQLQACKITKDRLLLGMHTGTTLTKRNRFNVDWPSFVIVFKKSIEYVCKSKEEIKTLVTNVVKHEIGHFFGMTEEQIREAMRTYD